MALPSPGKKAKELLFPNCVIVEDNITKNLALAKVGGKYYLTNTKSDGSSGTKVYMEFTISDAQLRQRLSLLVSQLGSAQKTKNTIWTVVSVFFIFILALAAHTWWSALIIAAATFFVLQNGRGFCLGKSKVVSIVIKALGGTDIQVNYR